MKKFILIAMFISSSMAWANETKLTSNTLLQIHNRNTPTAAPLFAAPARNSNYMEAYIRFNDPACVDELRALGVKVRTVGATVMTASIPYDKIEAVSNLPSVDVIEAAQEAHAQMDVAKADTRAVEMHQATAETEMPFTGKGVLVGVIDGGVQFTHPAFRNPETGEMRIKTVWCQDDTKGTAPKSFGYGSEYNTPEAIAAKGTDLRYYSHGCHVMGIAAGSLLGAPYNGVAYDADLAFSNFGNNIDTGISDAISYIFQFADSIKQPAVINMSLGTEMGPHDGTSLRDQLTDELAGPGRLVVGAGGNNGLINMHISQTFKGEDDSLMAGLAFLEGMSGIGEFQIWGEVGKAFSVRVCTVDKATMEPVYKSRAFKGATSYTGTTTLQKPYDQSSGYFSISTGISPLNNRPTAHIQMNISDYQPDKVLALLITGDDGSTIHAWANQTSCCFKKHLEVMGEPDNKYGTCEIGGVGKNIITVASYNTKNNVATLSGTPLVTEWAVNDISPFSNVGPTIDGRMKPDIAAPGSYIVSSFSETVDAYAQVHSIDYMGQKYYYGAYQGTSMASPHVCGVVATWLQAYPNLTPDNVREVLSRTARRDQYTGSEPNNIWGYGKIDAYAGLVDVLKNYTKPSGIEPVIENDWNLTLRNKEVHVLYFRAVPSAAINIYAISGSLVKSINGIGDCGEETVVPLNDLQSGAYLVKVSDGSKIQTIKIII